MAAARMKNSRMNIWLLWFNVDVEPEPAYRLTNEIGHSLKSSDSINPLFQSVLQFKRVNNAKMQNGTLVTYQGSNHWIAAEYSYSQKFSGCQSFDYYWIPHNPIYADKKEQINILSFDAPVDKKSTPFALFDFSQYNPGFGKLKLIHRPTGYYDEISAYDTSYIFVK